MLFTSDLHIGHKNIIKYRPEFKTPEEHDNFMIDKILSLSKRTVLTVIGDFLFDSEYYDEYIKILSEKKCRIKLIMGNHDSLKLYNSNIFEVQLPIFSYKNIWISHAPIHPDELRGRLGNIHGHLHKEVIMKDIIVSKYGGLAHENTRVTDERYFNVNIDVNNYEFVPVEKIKEYFKG